MKRLLILLTFASAAYAQDGQIAGFVKDQTSAVIPNAKVHVRNTATGAERSSVTNDSGLYSIPALPAGNYTMTIQAQGFQTAVREGIKLDVAQNARLDFQLQVGAAEQTVTVTGGAPLVNTEDASVSTVVDRQFAENLPLNGRSFQALIMLTPGVVLVPASFSSQGQFSVNGQRPDANYFTVDGASSNVGISAGLGLTQSAGGALPVLSALGGTNSLVSVDAMQEFRVQTSTFAPEFGRSPGGQVSIATRSGSNQFHGTLFEYLRNDVLDANNWFADRSNLPKPKERQNDFGGTLGGPLRRNNTFFFFSYEGLRLRQPQTQTTIVPSLASRQAAAAAVQPFLNAFPVPNGSDLGNGFSQFAASYSNPATLNAYSIRVDHTLTSKLVLFGRYNYSPSETTQRPVGGGGVLSATETSAFTTHTLTIGATANLTQHLNDEIRLNYSNVKGTDLFAIDTFGGAVPFPESLLLPTGLSPANGNFGFLLSGAGVSSASIANLSIGKNATNEQRQINVVNNVLLAVRKHQLKFGVDYRWLSPIAGPPRYQGFLLFTSLPSTVSGIAASVSTRAFRNVTLVSQNISAYAQDTWKLNPRLTLTYGLRWDINPALRGKNAESQPFAATNIDTPASLGVAPRGTPLYDTTHGNVAPRLGLAYELRQTPGWESVLRGGVGIFYDLGSGFLGQLTFGYPFGAFNTLSNVKLPLTAQQAAPPAVTSALPTASTLYVADPHLVLPRTYQWNLAVAQSLGGNQTLAVTYVGATGRDLLRPDLLFAPNASFKSTVSVTRNTGTSDYHALQARFQRRLSGGLQALASYTWSHSIDNSSDDSNTGNLSTPTSVSRPGVDRGNSSFDVRHALTGALTYDIPFPASSRLLRAVLGNWSLDSFITVQSAVPLNVVATTFFAGGVLFSARPNLVAGIPLYLYGPQFPGGKILNNTPNLGGPGCKGPYCAPPALQQGNLPRNTLRGFGAWQDDFAIRRQFYFTERIGIQFRAELFNVFNHPNFGTPTTSLSSALFGQSTQTLASNLGSGGANGGFNPLYQLGGPRSVQFALKLRF